MPDLNATTALQCATTLLLHAPCFLSTNQSHGVLFRWNDPETIGIDARPLPNEDDRVLATFCSKSHCSDAAQHAPDDRQFEIQRDALTLPSGIRIKLPECSCRDEGFVFFVLPSLPPHKPTNRTTVAWRLATVVGVPHPVYRSLPGVYCPALWMALWSTVAAKYPELMRRTETSGRTHNARRTQTARFFLRRACVVEQAGTLS